MDIKQTATTIVRSNEFELEAEIQRCRDQLQKYEVGTKEYSDALECYNTLLTQEKELKKTHNDVRKYVIAGGIGIVGVLLYRKLIDTSADPFFRDLAKGLLKVVHI